MASFNDVTMTNLRKIKKYGFKEEDLKTVHEAMRLRGPATLVLFNTGKLLVQGSQDNVKDTVKKLKFLGITQSRKSFTGCAIGTDETLKGDTFGGLVVAGFKADDEIRAELGELGVRDSKKMLKPEIVRVAKILMEKYPENYHIESLTPKEYNKENARKNVTMIMDIMHSKCYKALKKRSDILHIVDLYPGCSVGDIKEKQAESKYLEVAAASIIARYGGLKQIRELEQQAGFFIPFGSTNVNAGLLEIKKKSLRPENFVKMKFRNVQQFFG
ncbi:hypothetical protein JXC34_01775 [Candidatus Woesearchaeota archaeon]|nr:hypothetical protein [Candidatus Woesearchaeota archaeon]